MRKRVKAVAFGVVGFMILIITGLYIHHIGWANLKLMHELHMTKQSILPMEAEGEYVTKFNGHRERLKERMKKEGWTYMDQEGAGYFFEQDGQTTIVTAKQIWNRHYIVYKITDHVVDLSD